MRNGVVESAAEYGKSAAHSIEKTATNIPADAYLLGALGSIGLSLGLKVLGRDRDAEFVGHWAPTFLILGLFSKLMEHDRHSRRQRQ